MNSGSGDKNFSSAARTILTLISFVSFVAFLGACSSSTPAGTLSCTATGAETGISTSLVTSATVQILSGTGPFSVSIAGGTCQETSTSLYTCTGSITSGTSATVIDSSDNASTSCLVSGINTGVYSSTGLCYLSNGQTYASVNGTCPSGGTYENTGTTGLCYLSNGETYASVNGTCPSGGTYENTGTTGLCYLSTGQTYASVNGTCPSGGTYENTGTTGLCYLSTGQTYPSVNGTCPSGGTLENTGTTGLCYLPTGQTYPSVNGTCPSGGTLSLTGSSIFCTLVALGGTQFLPNEPVSLSTTSTTGQALEVLSVTVNGYPLSGVGPAPAFALDFQTIGTNTVVVTAETTTAPIETCTATTSVITY